MGLIDFLCNLPFLWMVQAFCLEVIWRIIRKEDFWKLQLTLGSPQLASTKASCSFSHIGVVGEILHVKPVFKD